MNGKIIDFAKWFGVTLGLTTLVSLTALGAFAAVLKDTERETVFHSRRFKQIVKDLHDALMTTKGYQLSEIPEREVILRAVVDTVLKNYLRRQIEPVKQSITRTVDRVIKSIVKGN